MKKFLSILSLIAVLSACVGRNSEQEPPIRYLSRSLTDTTFVGYHCLADYSPEDLHSAVAVIGDFDCCRELTSVFIAADFFDNINGRENPDELHDFAGEVIAPVFDLANAPYQGFIVAGNQDALRETAVAMAVASLGKKAYSNMYEASMGAVKSGSKVLVIASPYLCAYGYEDICGLFHTAPPVISAVDRMFLSALDGPEGDSAVLLSPREDIEAGIYRKVWNRLSAEYEGLKDYREFALRDEGLRESFLSLLDTCLVQNRSLKRLMYVPSDELDYDGFVELLEEIRNSPGIEMEKYRSVLDPDFRFVDANREAVKATYRMLRARNLFTHRIAYPEIQAFVTVPANGIPLESNDFGGRIAQQYKYNHSADASVEVFRTIALSRLYMPEKEYNLVEKLSEPVLLNVYRLTGEKY